MIAHLRGRERALEEKFGFGRTDAEWIALVALHSGSFLRAQYSRFTGDTRPTARVRALRLVKELQQRRLGHDHSVPGVGRVCRIVARPLYRALEAENIRHRRDAGPPHILRRVLSLDCVLGGLEHPWLPTEQEKVAACTALGIDEAILPKRVYGRCPPRRRAGPGRSRTVRPFGWKMPVAAAEGTARFAYIDTEAEGYWELESWGREHTALWAAFLERGWRVEVQAVSAVSGRIEGLAATLERWTAGGEQPADPPSMPSDLAEELRLAEGALRALDRSGMRRWQGLQGTIRRVAELQEQRDRPRPSGAGAPPPRLSAADVVLAQIAQSGALGRGS